MGCCSISPTNDGFRVELTDGFKQIVNKKQNNNDEDNLRKYNEFLEQENKKPQLISVLGRGRSVSQFNGTQIIPQYNAINTQQIIIGRKYLIFNFLQRENIKYWYPRPSVQSRTSLSPLNRSSFTKSDLMNIKSSKYVSKMRYSG